MKRKPLLPEQAKAQQPGVSALILQLCNCCLSRAPNAQALGHDDRQRAVRSLYDTAYTILIGLHPDVELPRIPIDERLPRTQQGIVSVTASLHNSGYGELVDRLNALLDRLSSCRKTTVLGTEIEASTGKPPVINFTDKDSLLSFLLSLHATKPSVRRRQATFQRLWETTSAATNRDQDDCDAPQFKPPLASDVFSEAPDPNALTDISTTAVLLPEECGCRLDAYADETELALGELGMDHRPLWNPTDVASLPLPKGSSWLPIPSALLENGANNSTSASTSTTTTAAANIAGGGGPPSPMKLPLSLLSMDMTPGACTTFNSLSSSQAGGGMSPLTSTTPLATSARGTPRAGALLPHNTIAAGNFTGATTTKQQQEKHVSNSKKVIRVGASKIWTLQESELAHDALLALYGVRTALQRIQTAAYDPEMKTKAAISSLLKKLIAAAENRVRLEQFVRRFAGDEFNNSNSGSTTGLSANNNDSNSSTATNNVYSTTNQQQHGVYRQGSGASVADSIDRAFTNSANTDPVTRAFAVAVAGVLRRQEAALRAMDEACAQPWVALVKAGNVTGREFHGKGLSLLQIEVYTVRLRAQLQQLANLCWCTPATIHTSIDTFSFGTTHEQQGKRLTSAAITMRNLKSRWEGGGFPRGLDLCTYLHDKAYETDGAERILVERLFVAAAEPYLSHIATWTFTTLPMTDAFITTTSSANYQHSSNNEPLYSSFSQRQYNSVHGIKTTSTRPRGVASALNGLDGLDTGAINDETSNNTVVASSSSPMSLSPMKKRPKGLAWDGAVLESSLLPPAATTSGNVNGGYYFNSSNMYSSSGTNTNRATVTNSEAIPGPLPPFFSKSLSEAFIRTGTQLRLLHSVPGYGIALVKQLGVIAEAERDGMLRVLRNNGSASSSSAVTDDENPSLAFSSLHTTTTVYSSTNTPAAAASGGGGPSSTTTSVGHMFVESSNTEKMEEKMNNRLAAESSFGEDDAFIMPPALGSWLGGGDCRQTNQPSASMFNVGIGGANTTNITSNTNMASSSITSGLTSPVGRLLTASTKSLNAVGNAGRHADAARQTAVSTWLDKIHAEVETAALKEAAQCVARTAALKDQTKEAESKAAAVVLSRQASKAALLQEQLDAIAMSQALKQGFTTNTNTIATTAAGVSDMKTANSCINNAVNLSVAAVATQLNNLDITAITANDLDARKQPPLQEEILPPGINASTTNTAKLRLPMPSPFRGGAGIFEEEDGHVSTPPPPAKLSQPLLEDETHQTHPPSSVVQKQESLQRQLSRQTSTSSNRKFRPPSLLSSASNSPNNSPNGSGGKDDKNNKKKGKVGGERKTRFKDDEPSGHNAAAGGNRNNGAKNKTSSTLMSSSTSTQNEGFPLSSALYSAVAGPILSQYKAVSHACVCFFLDHLALGAHLRTLRRTFFMEAGDWVDEFLAPMAGRIKDLRPLIATQLQSILQDSIKVSSLEEDPLASNLDVDILPGATAFQAQLTALEASSHTNNTTVAAEFGSPIKLSGGGILGSSTEATTTPTRFAPVGIVPRLRASAPLLVAPFRLDALDCVTLRYQIGWPLQAIITEECLLAYAAVFSAMLRTRRVSRSLVYIRRIVARRPKHLPTELATKQAHITHSQLQSLRVFVHEASRFVAAVQSFQSACTISGDAWSVLEAKMRAHIDNSTTSSDGFADLHELAELHRLHVLQTSSACLTFYNSPEAATEVSGALQAVLEVALKIEAAAASGVVHTVNSTSNGQRDGGVGEDPLCAVLAAGEDTWKGLQHGMCVYKRHIVNLKAMMDVNEEGRRSMNVAACDALAELIVRIGV